MSVALWRRAARVATVAAAGALALAGGSLARAVRLDPPPTPRAEAPSLPAALDDVRPAYPTEVLVIAAEADPFHPERRPPASRFRLPGEAEDTASAAPPTTSPALPVRLLGTMVLGAGGSAVLQLGSEPARLVRQGERIGDYTLARVEMGRAVLLSPDGSRTDLRVPQPGS